MKETKEKMDLTGFIKVGSNRSEAYANFIDFERGFDKEYRNELSYEDFCKELDKGYGNAECIQIARLYEDENGTVWYDNEYVG